MQIRIQSKSYLAFQLKRQIQIHYTWCDICLFFFWKILHNEAQDDNLTVVLQTVRAHYNVGMPEMVNS